MARRAQVVTRRILHRMYHQCGNTDTYLSPNPPRIDQPTRPRRPRPYPLSLSLPSSASIPPSRQILRVCPIQISSDTHPLYDLRASASFFQRWKKERDEYTRNTWAFVGTSSPFSRDATMLTPRVEYVFEQATNPLSPRPFDFERAVRFRRGKKEDLFLNFIPFSTYPTRLRPSPRRPRCSVERSP